MVPEIADSGFRITAATATGPAKGPLPASSTPANRLVFHCASNSSNEWSLDAFTRQKDLHIIDNRHRNLACNLESILHPISNKGSHVSQLLALIHLLPHDLHQCPQEYMES